MFDFANTNTTNADVISKFEELASVAAESLEADKDRVIEKVDALAIEDLDVFMQGYSVAIGVLGVTIMGGLTKIAQEVLNADYSHPIFDGAETDEAKNYTANQLAVALTQVMGNVVDQGSEIGMSVTLRNLMSELETAVAEAEKESGATIN